MKSIVIYDSTFGCTQKVAKEIAEVLGCEAKRVGNFEKADLKGLELLIVGSPINGWRPLPKVSEFLDSFSSDELKGVKASTFDTRVKLFIHGDAMGKMAAALKNAGAEIIIEPMAFYVAGSQQSPYLLDGELEKAKNWAKSISSKSET